MPRDGSGASHNAVEAGDNLIHGAGSGGNDVSDSLVHEHRRGSTC